MRLPVAAAAAASLAILAPATAGAVTYDANADWNVASNPNGPWSERAGNVVLPFVANWIGIDDARAPSNNGGNFLPGFFQATQVGASLCGGCDWLPGDLIVHTTDPGNGGGNGPANLLFTTPVTGTADVSGLTWAARSIGRIQAWDLLLNGASLVGGGGTLPGDFTNGRATPDTFTINGLHLNAGDQLELLMFMEPNSGAGDFVGYNLHVNLTAAAAPEPSTWALALLGFAGLGSALRRRPRRAVA